MGAGMTKFLYEKDGVNPETGSGQLMIKEIEDRLRALRSGIVRRMQIGL
jgi:hypothetical protein